MRQQLTHFGAFGTVLTNLALALYIPGFSAPYWLLKTSFPGGRSGVWKTCAEETSDNETYRDVCYDTNDYINDNWNSTWIPGLRAMTSLGLVTLLAAAVIANVYACAMKRTFNNGMVFASMCSSMAAWFFTITGVLIHGIRRADEVFNGYKLSWAFGLCCASSCLVLMSSSLFFAEIVRLNRLAIRKMAGKQSNHNGRVVPAAAVPSEEGATVENEDDPSYCKINGENEYSKSNHNGRVVLAAAIPSEEGATVENEDDPTYCKINDENEYSKINGAQMEHHI